MSESTKEALETLAEVLLHCWVVGSVLLIVTCVGLFLMRKLIHALWEAMYGLSDIQSNMIFVGYLLLGKMLLGVFFFIPWLAIWLVL